MNQSNYMTGFEFVPEITKPGWENLEVLDETWGSSRAEKLKLSMFLFNGSISEQLKICGTSSYC